MENKQLKYAYYKRRYTIAGIVIVLLLIFIIRLFSLQILSDDYKKWADSNAYQKRALYPSRGVIYDRNGKLLVYNKPSYDVMVIMREVQLFDTLDFCRTVGITKENFDSRMANIKNRDINPGYSSYTSQLFMDQLPANEYGVLQEKLYKFPGFFVRNRSLREYGCQNAANVLGYISETNANDIKNDDYYVPRDYIGRAGVESSYEKILRGEKGVEILLRDAHGRTKGRYEEGKYDIAPVSGKNITLSINMDLQAYGEKLLQNKQGAIVMIEPATGEILCLVTSPTYDPNLFAGQQRGENYRMLERDPKKPLLDRAIQGHYPPGSTFKAAQALVFLQEGVITKDKTYNCYNGYPYLDGHPACHSHGSPIALVASLATSCNSYYCWGYHEMLDPPRSRYATIQEAFEAWKNRIVSLGYGYRLGIDLPGENRGFIPNSEVYDNNRNKRWNSSSIISNAIGQGDISASPLQICNLAATIANRGYYIVPHVVHEIQDTPLDEIYRNRKSPGIDREYFDLVVEGMRNAVLGGTCMGLQLVGIEVCGKTGTVQNLHGRDHSACIAFAPMNNPKVAIAVFVENGGWGAKVAVPAARLMLQKYLNGDIYSWDKYREIQIINLDTSPGSIDFIKKPVVEDEHAE